MSELRQHKWDQRQCSYCGNRNTQFICWICHQSDIEDLTERLETLEFKFNELIDILVAHGIAQSHLKFTKVKESA